MSDRYRTRYVRPAAFALATAVLAACAGAPGFAPQPPAQLAQTLERQASPRLTTQMRVVIPAPRRSRAFFVAATTQGIDVTVTPVGGTTVLADVQTSLAPGSPNCAPAANGSRACAVPIPVPAGDDHFAFHTYDAPPSAGGGFGNARLLGVGSLEKKIELGSARSFTISIGGVVSTLELSLPFQYVHGTLPSSQTLGVYALDADRNVIVSDGYYDALGNPVTVRIALSADHGRFGGELALSADALSAPRADGVTLTYDGAARMPAAGDSGAFSSTISVSAAKDGSGAATGIQPVETVLHVVGPTVVEYAVGPGSVPNQLALGSDGNVWFTDSGTGKIGTIAPNGRVREVPIPGRSPQPNGIALGTDGKLWFALTRTGQIGSIDPQTLRMKLHGGANGPVGVAAAPDGSIWFTEPNDDTLAKIAASGAIVRFPALKAHSYPYRLTAGADGNMWFTQSLSGRIGVMSTAGKMVAQYALPNRGKSPFPTAIALGPHTGIWSIDGTTGWINKIIGGELSVYPPAGAQPGAIVEGADGNLWISVANGSLARVSPTGSSIRIFAAIPGAAAPGAMAVGSDGNLWFADARGRIGKFVW